MRPRFIRQYFVLAGFGMMSLALLIVAIRRAPVVGPGIFIAPLLPLVIAAVVMLLFRGLGRALDKKGEAVRASIERCAQRVFDRPGAVRPGYDMSVTTTPGMAAWVTAVDTEIGYTTEGTYGGARVSVASHVSTAGRQVGEFSHVYSYVCVDVLGANEPFFLGKQGIFSGLANAAGFVKDVPIGDAAFDGDWIIHADQALATDVLDDSIRARLSDLRAKVPLVSMDMAQGTMSVILTQHGLAIRWPGEMSPELATYMRDLLLDMRARILAHLDRRARAGMGEGYRVAGDTRARLEDAAAPIESERETGRLAAK